MKSGRLFLTALLAVCSCGFSDDPRGAVKALKAAKTPKAWESGLAMLGIPADTLKTCLFNNPEPNTENKTYLFRAESFNKDLNGDGKGEWVTQVIFSNPYWEGKPDFEYIVTVHDGKSTPSKQLWMGRFELSKCSAVEGGGMTFAIRPAGPKGLGLITFKIRQVTLCDVQNQEYEDRVDTLKQTKPGEFRFVADAHPKSITVPEE